MKKIKNKDNEKIKKININHVEKEERMKKYFELQQKATKNYAKSYKKRHGFTLLEYVDYMQRRKDGAKKKKKYGFTLE